MIKINLPNRTVDLPDTLSIDKFVKIMNYDINDKENWKSIISIILDCPIDELESADEDVMLLIMSFIILALNTREEVKLNDLEKLTFGQFVDLEVYLSLNYMQHLEAMLKIIAPYANTSAKAMWAIEKYLEWRGVIYKQYKGLFSTDENDDSESIDTNTGVINKMASAKSWYATIISLANEDILKIQQVEELGFRMCFNFMAYKKEQRLILEAEQRKNNAMNKLKRR